jgi:hypothetical protein
MIFNFAVTLKLTSQYLHAEPVSRIFDEKFVQKIDAIIGQIGIFVGHEFLVLDIFVKLILVFREKGYAPSQHFIHEGTQTPEINGLAALLIVENFRSHVLGHSRD